MNKRVITLKEHYDPNKKYTPPSLDSDAWDLKEVSAYQGQFKEGTKTRCCDFSGISSKNLREEVKQYLLYRIEDKKFSFKNLLSVLDEIGLFISFLAVFHIEVDSILNVDMNQFAPDYKEWLFSLGYKDTRKRVTHITKDMKKKIYSYNCPHIQALIIFQKYIFDLHDITNLMPEYDKPVWDVRNLPFRVEIRASRPRYTVNFQRIKQPWLLKQAKKYAYERLKLQAFATVLDDLKTLNLFSEYLAGLDKEVKEPEEVTLAVIEGYVEFVTRKKYKATQHNQRISGVRRFFEWMMMSGVHVNPQSMFDDRVLAKVGPCLPQYFSQTEMKQINRDLNEYPLLIKLFLIVLEHVGGRISDICEMEVANVLKKNPSGGYSIHYRQPKSRKWNSVACRDEIAGCILKAIEISKERFGPNTKYVFASGETECISSETISWYLNEMAYKHQYRSDYGTPLRIEAHAFRRTKATVMASRGIPLAQIAATLGQSTTSVLKNYINTYGVDNSGALDKFLEEKNDLIANIGHVQDLAPENVSDSLYVPMFHADCVRPLSSGICEKANYCYGCPLFIPEVRYLDEYRRQLDSLNVKLVLATAEGHVKLIEKLQTDIQNLTAVIEYCENELHGGVNE